VRICCSRDYFNKGKLVGHSGTILCNIAQSPFAGLIRDDCNDLML